MNVIVNLHKVATPISILEEVRTMYEAHEAHGYNCEGICIDTLALLFRQTVPQMLTLLLDLEAAGEVIIRTSSKTTGIKKTHWDSDIAAIVQSAISEPTCSL